MCVGVIYALDWITGVNILGQTKQYGDKYKKFGRTNMDIRTNGPNLLAI